MEPSANQRTFFDRFMDWVRQSVLLKLFSVAVVVLLLAIPMERTISLVHEREGRRASVVEEVSSKWGREQIVGGVVLSVPYHVQVPSEKPGEPATTYAHTLHILPDSLVIHAEMKPEVRARGIFEVPLYEATVTVEAVFEKPSEHLSKLEAGAVPSWHQSLLEVGVADIQGIRSAKVRKATDDSLRFLPSLPSQQVFPSGMNCPLVVLPDSPLRLEYRLVLRGSEALRFLPYGRRTQVHLTGTGGAAAPSFQGAFLPDAREVQADRFEAHWQVLDLNRNLPVSFVDAFAHASNPNDGYAAYSPAGVFQPAGSDYAFGVTLLSLINPYQQTERSTKYSLLFIFLTFLALFLSELLAGGRVHVVQYLLIGFTVIVFYTVLLALSEHLGFDAAYLLAALIITGYVTTYAHAAFRRRVLTRVVGGLLVVLYGFFYVLMQLEDYALLVGSLGLLLLVGGMLYITRKVDWYGFGRRDSAGGA